MTDRVMVFAPAPILTVTIEQHGDEPDLHVHPGGQGVRQARMISALGVPTTLCVALGGEPGSLLQAVLAAEEFDVRAVPRQSASGRHGLGTGRAEAVHALMSRVRIEPR